MDFPKRFIAFIKHDWLILTLIAAYCIIMNVLDMGCIFEWLTGISCPGCGLTRAWLCVLKLDFTGAFYYHPLWLIVPIVVMLYLIYDGSIFKNKKLNHAVLYVFAAVVVGVYVYRMFFMENSPIGVDLSASFILKLFSGN